jgi:hypothetical protein
MDIVRTRGMSAYLTGLGLLVVGRDDWIAQSARDRDLIGSRDTGSEAFAV